MSNAPVIVRLGSGQKKILVMSPVMPVWDHGAFFAPLSDYFQSRGYSLLIVDSLSLPIQTDEKIIGLAQRWKTVLAEHAPFDLIAGGALGGALAQLLALEWPDTPLLLISAPSRSTPALERSLSRMIELAQSGDLLQAEKRLAWCVLPESTQPEPALRAITVNGEALSRLRLVTGFTYLLGLDIQTQTDSHSGPLLNLIGERSRLVRAENFPLTPHPERQTKLIPAGGMRPLNDNLALVIQHIEAQLLQPAAAGGHL